MPKPRTRKEIWMDKPNIKGLELEAEQLETKLSEAKQTLLRTQLEEEAGSSKIWLANQRVLRFSGLLIAKKGEIMQARIQELNMSLGPEEDDETD